MRILLLPLLLGLAIAAPGQELTSSDPVYGEIKELIATYVTARESKDRSLLEQILTEDVDQLVSSGTWRRGKEECVAGMLRSSTNNPGERTITVDRIRLLGEFTALVDARYKIGNADGSVRQMWSTFLVVGIDNWQIAAIRNMLPAR